MRRNPILIAAGVLIAAAAAGSVAVVATGGEALGVYAGGRDGVGAAVRVGTTWSYGAPQILNWSGRPMTWKRIEVVDPFGGFEPLAVRIATRTRGENVLAGPGFPLPDHRRSSYRGLPYTTAPDPPYNRLPEGYTGNVGVEIVIAFRCDEPCDMGFKGLRVHYSLDGGEERVLDVAGSLRACSLEPGETPAEGARRCTPPRAVGRETPVPSG